MTDRMIDEILVLHHSHLDVGYTHAQPVVWELQGEYISQALDWLEETAELPAGARPKWTCEAYEPVLRWLRNASSADVARFVTLHRQGRIGVAALRWNASALPDRAGLERLVEGKAELESILGAKVSVACQHDVPGAQWALADVLIDAGVEMLVMGTNLHSARALSPRPAMFMWEAPSGRTLRVFNGHHYTMFDQLLYSWDDSVERMKEGWSELESHLARDRYSLPFVYLSSTCSPVMWDNAPPNPFLPDLIQRWNDRAEGPFIRYATFDDLLAAASAVPDETLEVRRGDWSDYWTFGAGSMPVATATSRLAKARLAEVAAVGTDRPDIVRRAQDTNDLFDEHTWGYTDPSPAHPQSVTAELLQRALAHEANELADFALMSGLERLAGNPVADRGVTGALIVNTADHSRVIRPSIPESWFAGGTTRRTYRTRRMVYDNRPWRVALQGESVRSVGAIELPPRSWRVVALTDLPSVEGDGVVTHRRQLRGPAAAPIWDGELEARPVWGTIETPYHTVSYDPETGRIRSLFDRIRGAEVLNADDEFDFFEFVRERADALVDGSRDAFYKRDMNGEKFDRPGWDDWRPIRERARRVIECTVDATEDRAVLIRRLEAPGLSSLRQTFTFSRFSPLIEIDVEFELEADTSPQAVYFATPLRVDAGWEASFDSAGEVIRLDDDQLPAACRGWVTVERFAAIADDSVVHALFTPDAPLIQFGTFRFGPPLDEVPREANPRLLAWVYNNYWMTNYPLTEPGIIRLRFGFRTYDSNDRTSIGRDAHDFAHPPIVWPVTTNGRPSGEGSLA